MKTIYGVLIRKQRESKGLSLAELADRCLIKEKVLKEAEKGDPVLSRADLVIICNVLDISSVALAEGRLVKKPGVSELEELILKLEKRADELQESIREMKEAAASLKGVALEKVLEKVHEAAPVQPDLKTAEPLGPVI